MIGCSCPHDVNEHGSLVHFPTRMCLVANCDCNGTNEEVVNAAVERSMSKQRIVHDLTDLIRNGLPGEADEVALEIATAICEKYEVEAK